MNIYSGSFWRERLRSDCRKRYWVDDSVPKWRQKLLESHNWLSRKENPKSNYEGIIVVYWTKLILINLKPGQNSVQATGTMRKINMSFKYMYAEIFKRIYPTYVR